jgi:hypothetical protein
LDGFLDALDSNEEIDAGFLAALRHLAKAGSLDDRSRIRKVVASLEARADELYD